MGLGVGRVWVIGWAMGVFRGGRRLKHNTCKTSVPPQLGKIQEISLYFVRKSSKSKNLSEMCESFSLNYFFFFHFFTTDTLKCLLGGTETVKMIYEILFEKKTKPKNKRPTHPSIHPSHPTHPIPYVNKTFLSEEEVTVVQ